MPMPRAVLLVHHLAEARAGLADILAGAGFRVTQADTGLAGIEYARQNPPDVLLCAVDTPGADGYTVLSTLRGGTDTALTPFIMLIPQDDPAMARKCVELGADDVLVLPLDKPTLLTAVAAQLSKYEQILEVYNLSLAQLERTKQRLSLMMAHELRTPLIGITMSHEILDTQYDELSDEQTRHLIGAMGKGVRRLNHRIEQMVLATQLESGLLSQEAIQTKGVRMSVWRLVQTAQDLARSFDYRTQGVGVRVDGEIEDAEVICHGGALAHAFAELLTNALTFTAEGSEIVLAQWRAEPSVMLSIVDRGPGISLETLQQALTAFEQIEREKYEQQGIGMGLWLAKQIIEAHGGVLALKSLPGSGTQVVVGLPFVAPEDA
ncbi:MAG: ATP-binding protein [Anaerolineales bacterium]